ncbi:MAG: hypothetical protein CMJ59_26225 [Planctomycetaceae bacterium]|nr:hypothetical protein [Planctomycetaceae bacterium]MAV38950.1 hypothetical protein [Planctomycetaceae bacterium]
MWTPRIMFDFWRDRGKAVLRGQYSRNVKREALTPCRAETPIPAGLDKHRTGVHPLVTPQACSQFFDDA